MKKIFYFIGAAGLLLNGCKEPAVDDAAFAPESSAVRTLTVNGVVETGTRAVWDDETKFSWENDDKITLVSDGTSYVSEGLAIDPTNAGHGVFTVKNVSGTTFNAFVTANGTYKTDGVEFTVGDTEITAGEVSLKSNVLLVSTESVEPEGEELNVPLTIVTPLVKFLVYGEASGEAIESISIKANAANIAGTASYSFDGNKVTVSDGKASVKATVSDATVAASKEAADGLYLSVLPTTVSDITYVVTTSAKTYNFTSKSGQTFAQNTIYTLPLNLANADADAAVEVTDVTVEDGGTDNKFYLGKTVTVTGTNLDKVSVVKIGETEISDVEAENTTMTFTVPEELEFETESNYEKATEFKLTFDGDNAQSITVYPFYYFKGVKLAIGVGSKDNYNDYIHDNAFFVPDYGRVLSVREWIDEKIDPNVLDDESGSPKTEDNCNTIITTYTGSSVVGNKLAAGTTKEQYYCAKPYILCSANTSGVLSIVSTPCGTNARIKNHRYKQTPSSTSYTALPTTCGTPIFGMKVITSVDTNSVRSKIYKAVAEGTLTSMDYTMNQDLNSSEIRLAGSGASGTTANMSDVIVIGYANYEFGLNNSSETQGVALKSSDIYQFGYIKFNNITGANFETGLVDITALDGKYVDFDIYWSKPLREK